MTPSAECQSSNEGKWLQFSHQNVFSNWGEISRIGIEIFTLISLTTIFVEMEKLSMTRNQFYPTVLPWDQQIPLVHSWIWVYLTYYPFCLGAVFFPAVLKNARFFWAILWGFLFQFITAGIIFYLFPTRIIHSNISYVGLTDLALQKLYAVDHGFCILPSLHVANVFFVSLVSTHFLPRKWSAFLFLIAALIAASTVLIKQHLLVDVPSGAFLGFLAYWIITRNRLSRA